MARDLDRFGNTYAERIASCGASRHAADQTVPNCEANQPGKALVRKARRPVALQDEIDLDRIERALEKLAALVIETPRYAPIFDRLMTEREQLIKRQDAVSRAQAFLAQREGSCEVVRDL